MKPWSLQMKRAVAKPGIRTKMTIIFVMLFSLTIISYSLILLGQERKLMERGLFQRVVSLARNLARNAEYGVLIENEKLLLELIKGVLGEDDIVYVSILDKAGKVLAREGDKMGAIPSFVPRPQENGKIMVDTFPTRGKNIYYEIVLPIKTTSKKMATKENLLFLEEPEEKNRTMEIGTVRIGLSLANVASDIARLTETIIYLSLLGLLLGILFNAFYLRKLLKPIEQLASATHSISRGDYSYPVVETTSRDEIGELATSFNRMSSSLAIKKEEVEKYTTRLEKSVAEREEALAELQATQAHLVQSEKLAGIGILASGVAHEINNPLQGVLSKANKILREVDEKDAVMNSANKIKDYSKRIADIVKELSSYARDARNEGRSTIDLKMLIEEALKMAAYSRAFADISVIREFTDIPPVIGNTGQLQQVFVNLITNAVDAMDGKGDLILRTWIEADPTGNTGSFQRRKEDKAAFVEVIDTGAGIKEEDLARIFNPLFTTKEPGKGTGLGLSVVHRILAASGGKIDVWSETGKGTTFRISLSFA